MNDIDDNGTIIFSYIPCIFHSEKLKNFRVYNDIRP